MRIFTPEFIFRSVAHISPSFLAQQGLEALVLDVDNTLTRHDSQEVSEEVLAWLGNMQASGIRLMLASNNFRERVQPFAERLQLPFASFCCKPSPRWLLVAKQQWQLPRARMALVGDQIFTDALAGHLAGVTVLLVRPIAEDSKSGIRLKRSLEAPFIAKYYKKGGKLL